MLRLLRKLGVEWEGIGVYTRFSREGIIVMVGSFLFLDVLGLRMTDFSLGAATGRNNELES